jgi:hypothetical protein
MLELARRRANGRTGEILSQTVYSAESDALAGLIVALL